MHQKHPWSKLCCFIILHDTCITYVLQSYITHVVYCHITRPTVHHSFTWLTYHILWYILYLEGSISSPHRGHNPRTGSITNVHLEVSLTPVHTLQTLPLHSHNFYFPSSGQVLVNQPVTLPCQQATYPSIYACPAQSQISQCKCLLSNNIVIGIHRYSVSHCEWPV